MLLKGTVQREWLTEFFLQRKDAYTKVLLTKEGCAAHPVGYNTLHLNGYSRALN